MSILDEIVNKKYDEVADAKKQRPQSLLLQQLSEISTVPRSLKQALSAAGSSGIIAEFKRRSPSKGVFPSSVDPSIVAASYEAAGATAISVLTDESFFGGSLEDLKAVRAQVRIPILRKDFIVDEYQLLEARLAGADVVLLIAAALSPQQISQFSARAKELGLEVLLEVHDAEELQLSLCKAIDLVGVNNRNLKNFEVHLSRSIDLAALIPAQFVKIAESGISEPQTINELRRAGYNGFLMGEAFMRTQDPGRACLQFIQACRQSQGAA